VTDPLPDGSEVRLHVVSGKGGTGKTTVAAALALALARNGKRVLLCEVEGRQGIAQVFDVAPLPYEERSVAVASGGGEVFALAIDPEAALLEYLDMYYRLGRAGKALDRFGIVDFATTIAPGVRDVLLTGKVYEANRRRDKQGKPTYDAIVGRRAAHRPDRALPQRQPRGRRTGQGRSDPQPGRLDHGDDAQPPHRGSSRDGAGGHARAGDDRRHRGASCLRTCRWAR
jgi:hypothetical protein